MTRTGIKLDLDVGDLVSNAGRARGAISALTDAMQKAEKEERWEDFDQLSFGRDRLKNRNAGFERDIRAFADNPRFQAQTPGGGTVLKIDAEYAELIKGQAASMRQFTDELGEAAKTGNAQRVWELTPQIERQQADFHKVIEEARGLPVAHETPHGPIRPEDDGDPRRRTEQGYPLRRGEGIYESIGGLASSADGVRRVILNINKEIEKAKTAGDDTRVGQLSYTKHAVNTAHKRFEQDVNTLAGSKQSQQIMDKQAAGQSLSKREEAYISHLDLLNDTLKKNTAALLEASKTGDAEEMLKQTPQVMTRVEEFHQAMQGANIDRGMKDTVKAIGVNQIASAINDGFSRWAGSLDRSGIVNQYGSGDVFGGRISEKRRQADLAGGIAQSGLGIVGAIAGSLIPGVGTMAGGAGGAVLGKLIDTVLHIGPNKEANEAAYAGLWQNRSGQAMELAALMGDPNKVRDAFNTAAEAAARFGYSAEEGMEAMKEAAQQGLSGKEAKDMAERVFDYERRTGADRGTLMGISTMSARYGAGDALGTGWAGLQASGMKQGQYSEYLRAMQRVMEDGIGKGIVRSSEQAAQSLTMLSQITGNDPLWQGQNGARRLSEMNAGLESATALSSTSDILAFKAARNVLSNGGQEESDYTDVMLELEKGLTPKLFKEFMKLAGSTEGGDRRGIVEQMIGAFKVNYTNARKLYDNYDPDKEYTQTELDKYKNGPPPANSPELDAAKTTAEITNWWTATGQIYWDEQLLKLPQELAKAIEGYRGETGTPAARKSVDETLADLEAAASDPSATGEDIRRTQNAAIEAQVLEGKRQAEIERMLIKSGMSWDKDRAAFFTGDANPFTKNDDEKAFDRLAAYEEFPEARQALDEVYDILKSFTPDQIKRANEEDIINSAIPMDVMTDRTGQLLLQAIRELKEITVRLEEPN